MTKYISKSSSDGFWRRHLKLEVLRINIQHPKTAVETWKHVDEHIGRVKWEIERLTMKFTMLTFNIHLQTRRAFIH